MKRFTISIFLTYTLFAGIASCKKTTTNLTITDGTYKGTFQRQILGIGNIAKVTLVFNSNNWTGQSDTPKYPALCNGSFQTNGIHEVSFTNNCFWTADFDWTLILDQKFRLQISGNDYVLTKDYGNGTKDIYKLTNY